MPLPLVLTVPAAAAGLAYLNAKTSFSYDAALFKGLAQALYRNNRREATDRTNVFYRLEEIATGKSADRVGILFEDRSWTYRQMYDAALKYGNYLKTRFDLKPKDIVALDLLNSDHFLLITFGLWSIGVKPAYINYNLTSDALCHCVETANSVLMLVDPDVESNIDDGVRQRLGALRIEFLTEAFISSAMAVDPVRPSNEVRSGDLGRDMAILIYTSGTTGLPKAAIVSWSKVTTASSFVKGWLSTKRSDILYTPMPLYHSSATILGFFQCFEAEATFAVGRKFSTKTFWKDVRKHNATIIQYVGETCRYLMAAKPEIDPATGENLDKKHNVRLALGNGLRPDVWARFQERFGIESVGEFYASTEGSGGTWNYSRNDFSRGAIGRNGWLYGLFMRSRNAVVARDHETDAPCRDPKTGLCISVPRGEIGELLFALPEDITRNFQGYYNNPSATDKKILRDVFKKGDAYFRTGDLMSWDSEGRMYFHDRIGDTFRWKSENVATTEVSATIGLHPAVDEANVYGVQLPNHDGRAGCAAIALKTSPNEALLRSLAEHARAKLPKYAVPIFLRLGHGLSAAITGTNKQQKHRLRLEGVDPVKVGDDELYWLKGDTYVRFGAEDWARMNAGQVKL
ncbi:putative AMP-binding enzyme [Rosellinia necatrix]|uniref:Very long-chain fatty acid transport protein n=1 Tax=Rosellinia necatrix TaxID=77044 RepID=A0A1W2TST9_ROSNE|nr:putative AMP-binding enzyme [Rosellinia necatrix]